MQNKTKFLYSLRTGFKILDHELLNLSHRKQFPTRHHTVQTCPDFGSAWWAVTNALKIKCCSKDMFPYYMARVTFGKIVRSHWVFCGLKSCYLGPPQCPAFGWVCTAKTSVWYFLALQTSRWVNKMLLYFDMIAIKGGCKNSFWNEFQQR